MNLPTFLFVSGLFFIGGLGAHLTWSNMLEEEEEPTYRDWSNVKGINPEDAVVVLFREAELPIGQPSLDAAASVAAESVRGYAWAQVVLLRRDWQEAQSWMRRNQVPVA